MTELGHVARETIWPKLTATVNLQSLAGKMQKLFTTTLRFMKNLSQAKIYAQSCPALQYLTVLLCLWLLLVPRTALVSSEIA
jgi:hypothetical protein